LIDKVEHHCDRSRIVVTDKSGYTKPLPSDDELADWLDEKDDDDFPITVRELAPKPISDKYQDDHESAELYLVQNPEVFSFIKSLNKHTDTHPMDKARLLCSLVKSNRLPDTIIAFENAAWPKKWEVDWLNYVVQRQISAAAKRTLDDVLQTKASLLYSYQHGTGTLVQLKEARVRWCSIVLGYPYPYLPEERPSCLRYLNPDDVIQFMYRNKTLILEIGAARATGTHLPSQADQVPVLDFSIRKSPLFKHVVELACSDDDVERAKANSTIERLYQLWLETQVNHGGDGDSSDSQSVEKLTDSLLELLLPGRYQHVAEMCRENKDLNKLIQKADGYQELLQYLESFAKFVKKHGNKLNTDEDRESNKDLRPDKFVSGCRMYHMGDDSCNAENPVELHAKRNMEENPPDLEPHYLDTLF
jgi:hypothetical protein